MVFTLWMTFVFQTNILPWPQGSKSKLCKWTSIPLPAAHYSTLKMVSVQSSKPSVISYQTTQCYNPGDNTLHSHHCKSLNYILFARCIFL
jgi:hypothetical protein